MKTKRRNNATVRKKKTSAFKLKLLCMAAVWLCPALVALGQSSRYYWVGKGDGYSWNQIMNWSSSSGGEGGATGNISQVPTNSNTIVFDANSFTASGKRITLSGSVQCDSLIVESDSPISGFSTSGSNTLIINGSLLIKKTGLIWSGAGIVRFASNQTGETIQTQGMVFGSSEGRYGNNYGISFYTGSIYFSGSGEWILADDFTTNARVYVQSGTLNVNGKTLSTHTTTSNGGKIVFPHATINCSYAWVHNSASSPALTADDTEGSLIRVTAFDFKGKSDDRYHNLEFTGGMYMHGVSAGQFNKITVLNGSATIGSGSSIQVTTDSLVISATNHYNIRSATVNKYLEAKPPVPGGQVRLFASNPNDIGIIMQVGAVVNVERAVIHDLKIEGVTAEAKESLDWGGTSGWTFTPAPQAGKNMYWIGGEGWWNDPGHWSFSPGGSPAGRIPTLADNVFFHSTSGIPTGGVIKMNGDAWCNDMTWNGAGENSCLNLCGVATSANNDIDHHSENYLMTGGSMTLQSGLIVNKIANASNAIYFVSDRSTETIVTNNATMVAAHIYFQSVSGTGKWKLTGDLNLLYVSSNPTSNTYRRNIYFNRGGLDVSGQRIVANSFTGNEDTSDSGEYFSNRLPSRTLNMANAVFDLVAGWRYVGGQQLTADQSEGSVILAGVGNNAIPSVITKADDHYYNAELRTSTGGNIYSLNKEATYFNKVVISAPGVKINSTNNKHGVICPDSLLFTGNGTYAVNRNFTVNKYLSTSTGCGGNTTLTATAATTITLGETANENQLSVSNTHLKDISLTPYPGDGYDVYDCTFEGTTEGWNNTDMPSKNLYWVGGDGNWSDGANWSTVSGMDGSVKGDEHTGCVPRQSDNVFFDDGSFDSPGQIVMVDVSAYCHDMRWIGSDVEMQPELRSPNGVNLYISGSLELQAGMRFKYPLYQYQYLYIHFTSDDPEGETIISNGVEFNYSYLAFENANGRWTLADDLAITHLGSGGSASIRLVSGVLDFGGHTVTTDGLSTTPFSNDTPPHRDTRTLIIKNSTINLHYRWDYTGNLQAENATINHLRTGSFTAEAGARYHNYNYKHNNNLTGQHLLRGGIWDHLNIEYPHRIRDVETDTLSLSKDIAYTYFFQDTIRVNNAFHGNGTPCNTIYLQSYEETQPAYLDIRKAAANMPNDTLLVDYAYIHGLRPLTGEDNAHLYKGSHAPDVDKSGKSWGYGMGLDNYNNEAAIGETNSWARMDNFNEEDSSPFGENKMLGCHLFPYQLSSANFAPTPNARFKWFKCNYAQLDAAFKSLPGSDMQKFDNLDSKLDAPESTGPECLVEGDESGETYTLIVDYGNGCVAYDDITITKIVFPGCEPIETCDNAKEIDLKPYLPGVDFTWGEDPNATVDENQIITVNRPAASQPQTVSLPLYFDKKPEDSESGANPADPFTVTVRFNPSVMVWLGKTADWHDAGNWYPEDVPYDCTDVYIAGMSVEGNETYYFPSLTGSQADNVCGRIFFLPGAQLGRPDLLTYAEAHVEIDYGKGSLAQQAGLAYTAFVALGKESITSQDRVQFAAQYSNLDIALQRGRWNMLSAPLKEIVTGDFAFGGFPFSFIQQFDAESGSDSYIKGSWAAFKSETDFELKPGQGFGHFYYDYMNNTPYGMDNSAGAQWDNAKTYSSLTAEAPGHKDGSSAFGLAQQNGILHFPYFADDYLSATRRIHEYSGTKTSGTSTFHFVYQSPLKSTLFLQFTGDKEEMVRTGNAYRFITDGDWTFDYEAGKPGASKLALVGNPYMSALDFDAFYAANAGKIKNGYQIYAKAPQSTGDTYAEYDGQMGDRHIAPMQSFLVETTEGFSGKLSLTFAPEMAVTNTGTKLRASGIIADRLTIAASNANGRTSATVRWLDDAKDGFCNRDISKIIDNVDNLPRVYTLAGMDGGKLRALSVNSIHSNHAVIPIGVTSSYKGDVTFAITGMDAYDAEISFVDAVTGARQDITGQGEFTYTYTHNGDKASVEDRFYLHFSKASTGTEDIVATRLNAYAQQADLIILAPDSNPAERVTVYDIQGRLLSEHQLSGSSPYRVENAFGEPGIYAVKIHTNQAVYSIKVIR